MSYLICLPVKGQLLKLLLAFFYFPDPVSLWWLVVSLTASVFGLSLRRLDLVLPIERARERHRWCFRFGDSWAVTWISGPFIILTIAHVRTIMKMAPIANIPRVMGVISGGEVVMRCRALRRLC